MYDDSFYATSRAGMITSAEALVPVLIEDLGISRFDSLIDVGCGEGWWAKTFADHGLDATGIDGVWHGDHQLGDQFIPHDLNTPLPSHLTDRFDVAVCLEVAEHLQPRRARPFVTELCSLAPLIIFSAAIPGQGGTGHLNEQWPDYWAEMFNTCGFAVDGDLRYKIWEDSNIENWYRQNLLVARKFPTPIAYLPPLRLVHPVLYDARRTR